MGKILVKASQGQGPQIQMGPNGPQMFYNVGVGGGGRGGNGVRGGTKRGKAAALAGGAVGVLGGLGCESRSLGGFLSNLQVGAMQGSAVGRGLAGLGTSRRRQARADLVEGRKQAQAKDDAQARLRGEEEYAQRPGQQRRAVGQFSNVASPEQGFMRRVSGRNMTNFGRQIQQEEGRLQEEAKVRAQQQRELDKQGFKGDVRQWMEAQKNLPSQETVNTVSNLAGTAAPVQQMAPIGPQPATNPSSAAAQIQIGDSNDPAAHTKPLGDHDNELTENQQNQQGGGGDEEEQQGQKGGNRIGTGFRQAGSEGMDTILFPDTGGQ